MVASLIPFFNELIGLIAALVSSSTTFGMPAIMYLIEFRKHNPWWNWILALSCIIIGYSLLGLGSYTGIYSIIQAVPPTTVDHFLVIGKYKKTNEYGRNIICCAK